MFKKLLEMRSPAGTGARLSIFIFHRVLTCPDPLFPGEPDIRRFDDMVGWVSHWFTVLPLDKAIVDLQNGALPARAAAITFDDGYADNVSNAMPVLLRHGVRATFFVSTAFLDGGRMWNDSIIEAVRHCPRTTLDLRSFDAGVVPLVTWADKRQAIALLLARLKYREQGARQSAVHALIEITGAGTTNDLMMRSDQLLALRDAGMQIGAHTVSHPILERMGDPQARWEIEAGKADLESRLDQPVVVFAYPNGKLDVDYSARHVAMVRDAGFVGAVSTAQGAARYASDPHQLPRFTPWDRSRMRYGLRLLSNLR